jgi:hypothetical protein
MGWMPLVAGFGDRVHQRDRADEGEAELAFDVVRGRQAGVHHLGEDHRRRPRPPPTTIAQRS